ncbi:hypothetical protein LguiB_025394 [Lonicera macranthoides]
MAGIRDSTIKSKSKSKPRRKYFLGRCFGFSDKKMSDDVVKSSKSRKKNRFLSWLRFQGKKLAIKTVPVDTASPEKLCRSTEIEEIAVPVTDQTVNNKPHKKRYENSQNILLESSETIDSAKNTCQKVILRVKKKDSKRKSISHQGSPDQKKSSVSNNILFHSASLPAIQVPGPATGDSHIDKEKSHKMTTGKYEPVVGMSIIMMTLIIMIVWGKLCAILCTCAWFYFLPRLKKSIDSNNVDVNNRTLKSGETDINSEEYKKKVVLEGLLRRSRRNVAGVL